MSVDLGAILEETLRQLKEESDNGSNTYNEGE
jgi:hypothetical protein